ncbi:MAG TPA: hypothetical protein VMS22_23455 [Candidatus Eisenbacteria bacterium]|nr:hypothetical protein [Candidatus Eisenbacteria bacterium]
MKGAEAKAGSGIVKGCAKDCPECYAAIDPSLCSSGQPFVGDVASQTDPFGTLIYCTEAAGGTPTQAEGKCEDIVMKTLGKFWNAETKCYQKCVSNELKGRIAPGSCSPPVPSDAATQACLFDPGHAEAKAALVIDKVCEPSINPSNQKPACYSAFPSGSYWVSLIEAFVDFRVPITWCSEPTGTTTTTTTTIPNPVCCSYPGFIFMGVPIPAKCGMVPTASDCLASQASGVCRSDGTCGTATGPGDCCVPPEAATADACEVYTSSTSTFCNIGGGTFEPNTVCTPTGCQ